MIPSLDNFYEQCRSVLGILGEDLQQVAVIIIVDQDV